MGASPLALTKSIYYHTHGQQGGVVISIQTFRRNLKKLKLKPLCKRYLAAIKSYNNALKEDKENAKTLHQRSNKDHRKSICV